MKTPSTFRRTAVRVKWVKCGKANCAKCPHGPYLYRVWREGAKVKTEYVGKAAAPKLPPNVRPGRPSSPHPLKAGARVRFVAGSGFLWVMGRRGKKAAGQVREDRPPMVVETIGWAPFFRKEMGEVYPYVTLTLPDGRPVYHPYDDNFRFLDKRRRLDRRFPIFFLES